MSRNDACTGLLATSDRLGKRQVGLLIGGIIIYAIWRSTLAILLMTSGGLGVVIMLTSILFDSFGELPAPEMKQRDPPTSHTIH